MQTMQKFAKLAALGFLFIYGGPCLAQGWDPWADELFGGRRWNDDRRWQEPDRPPRSEARKPPPTGGDIRSGGARPEIAAATPPTVDFSYDFPANSIVIVTGIRKLYYVLPDQKAHEYRISVGREGFNWMGTEKVSRKQAWPDWHPPAEMRERDPSLPEKMTGGLKNPLGALALYLGNTLYRIHGTNDVKSIGHAQSSGCFRMLNTSVRHLASITEIGTSVSVVSSLSDRAKISRAPQAVPSPSVNQQPPADRPAPSVTQQLPTDRPAPSASQQPPADRSAPSASQQLPSDRPAPSANQPPPASQRAAQPPSQPVAAAKSERDSLPDYAALRNYTLGKQ